MPTGRIGLLVLFLVVLGCGPERQNSLVNPEDYKDYLNPSSWEAIKEKKGEISFWSSRLRPDSSGLGELGPLAAAYSELYDLEGEYSHLLASEKLLHKAVVVASLDRSAYVRSLCRILIKQHRFTDALELAIAEIPNIGQSSEDQFLLFDCYLEIGQDGLARAQLEKVSDPSNLAYLIRLARLLDHQGELKAAIRQLEKARQIALSRNQTLLINWTTSNLADFYLHDGRLQEAYLLYLETLSNSPGHIHSWKGLAWLVYAVDKDIQKATTILDSVARANRSPELILQRLDMARYQNDHKKEEVYKDQFLDLTMASDHGALFRIPHAYEVLDRDIVLAEELVNLELQQRQTLQTQVLTATIKLKQDMRPDVMEILQDMPIERAEPATLYHLALLYDQLGNREGVKTLQDVLLDTAVELGPYRFRVIKEL